MSFTLLTPLASLVFGVLLLDEPLTLELVVAATGVTLGLWLVNRR
jgi:drug/metabolite transporter (DMT)-like permease